MAVISSEMRGALRRGGVGDLFDHHAQQRTGDDGGAHSGDRAKTQLVHDEPGHVCAHHDDIAVGKVQQQDNAVHHAVAQCDQCIDAAKGQAVDQLAKEHCHGWILPFFAAFTLFDIKNGERLTRKKLFRRSPENHGVCSVRAAPSPVDGTARIRTFPSARACRPRRSGWQCS